MVKTAFVPKRQIRALSLLIVAASLLASCGKSQTVEEYLRAARASREVNDVPAAIINLKNALQKDPKNLDARVLLARSYVDLGDGVSAAAELTRATEEGADSLRLGTILAESELLDGKAEAALADAVPPEGVSPLVKADFAGVRVRALLALGRFDEARSTLAAAADDDPHSIQLQTAMVTFDLSQRDLAAAREHIIKAQAALPNVPKLVALRGTVEFNDGKYADAEQFFKDASTLQAWNGSLRLELARAQIAEGKVTEANAYLDTLLQSNPKNAYANYLRSLSAFSAKDYLTAANYGDKVLGVTTDYAPALLISGSSAYALGRFDQAASYLGRYVFLVPSNTQARKLLASAQLQVGRAGDAVKALSPAVGQANQNGDTLLLAMIGSAAVRSGDLAAGARYLTMAVDQQPNNSLLRTELGMTKVSLGQTSAGIDELEKAARDNPDAQGPEIALMFTHIRNQKYDLALTIAQEMARKYPNNSIGYDFVGTINLITGDEETGAAALRNALKVRPGDPMALRNLAALAVKNHKYDEAGGYYKELLKTDPKNAAAPIALAQVQMFAGEFTDAEATLKSGIEQNPNDPTPRIVLGRVLILQGRAQEALDAVAPVLNRMPKDPSALEVSGQAQLALGHPQLAFDHFTALAAVIPNAPATHRYLAEALSAAGSTEEAIAEVRKAIQGDPTDGSSKFLLARLLLAQQNYDEALGARRNLDEVFTIVDELQKQYPDNPEIIDFNGTVTMKQSRPQDAAALFKRALALRDSPIYRGHLATAQARAGQIEEAEKTLKPWIAAHPEDTIASVALVDVYTIAKRPDDAMAAARDAFQRNPQDNAVKVAYAHVLIDLKNYDEARKVVDELARDNPLSAEMATLAGTVASAQNRNQDAIDNFGKAVQFDDSTRARANLAEAQLKAGQSDEAEKTLKRWSDAHPDDFAARIVLGDLYLSLKRPEDAKAQYISALQRNPDSAIVENNLAWALSQLDQGREALPHARHAAALAPDAPDVLDTLGVVLIQNRNAGEALRTLQRAASLAPDSTNIQFDLARAFAEAGRKDQAVGVLRTLIDKNRQFNERTQAQKMLTELGG